MLFIKKKLAFITILALITIFFAGISTVGAKVVFEDVPADHKYYNAIYSMLYDGIYDAEKESGKYLFKPDSTFTRAEAVKFITVAILGSDADNLETSDNISDVPSTHWANKYVTFGIQTGIVNKYLDGTFKPDAKVTYGEIIKMLVCAKDAANKYKSTSPWYDGYIKVASDLGITKDIVHPGYWEVSRGLVAQLIYNFKNITNIPKLYFTGDLTNMITKSDERKISVSYKSDGISFDGFAKIKVQGTSSLAYNKKNYTINLFTNNSYTSKKKVDMGWGAQSKYCLKANWIDKTHARNIVSAKLVTQMQKKYNILSSSPANGAIDGFPVEIYINGTFHGLYTMNIPKDAWMFGMNEDNPNNIVLCGEGWDHAARFKASPTAEMWALEVGEDQDYALKKLGELFDFVMNSSDEEFKANFREHLSMNATLHYYIMTDFSYLLDNLGKNMLLATYDGKKWYPCLYDLDTSWGTNATGDGLLSYEQYLVGFDYNLLFHRLEQCFPELLAQRYFELRQSVLSRNNILFKFKAFESSIPQTTFAQELIKWGPVLPGYDYEQIEAFLDNMIPRLDAKYAKLKK